MKNKSRKNSLIVTAVLSMLLGVQVVAFAAPYDEGWIIGYLCRNSSTPNSCIGELCHNLFDTSPNECDIDSCIAGGRDKWNQAHPGSKPLPKPLPCMPSA
jgi:hypothetical protein